MVEHPHDEVLGGEGHLIERGQHRHPLEHQRRHRDLPAGVDGADRGVLRQLDPVEEDLVEARRAGDLAQGPDRHPGSVHVDDEHRQAAMLGQARIGAGEQQAEVRELRHRRPHLLAVDHPSVAAPARLGDDPGEIGSRRGLGEELTPAGGALEHGRQVAVLLLVAAVGDDRRAELADRDVVDDRRAPGSGQLGVGDHLLGGTEPGTTELRGPGDADEAGLRELRLPLPIGGGVGGVEVGRRRRRLGGVRRDPLAGPSPELGLLGCVVQIHPSPRSGQSTGRCRRITNSPTCM